MKKLVVILTVALIALGGGAIVLWRQLDAERQLNADLQKRVKDLESARTSFASMFRQLQQPAGTATDPKATAPVDRAAVRARLQQNAQQTAERTREALSRPETRQAIAGTMRAFLPMMLPDLAKELNLSPAELEKFYDLLGSQTNGLLGQLGSGGSRQDIAGNLQEAQKNSEAQIAALLGDKYPQWKQYEGSLGERNQVNQLQNTLATTGNKLSDDQVRPLITALAAEQNRINQDRTPAPAGQNLSIQERLQQRQQQNAANNQRMVQAASPYMTSAQLDAYKAQLERPGGGRLGALGGMMGGGMGGGLGGGTGGGFGGGMGGTIAPPR